MLIKKHVFGDATNVYLALEKRHIKSITIENAKVDITILCQ